MRTISQKQLDNARKSGAIIRTPKKKEKKPEKKPVVDNSKEITQAAAVVASALAENGTNTDKIVAVIEEVFGQLIKKLDFSYIQEKRKYQMQVKRDARGFISTVDVEEL